MAAQALGFYIHGLKRFGAYDLTWAVSSSGRWATEEGRLAASRVGFTCSSDVAMCALGRGRSRKAEEDSSPDVLRRPFGDPILSTSAHSADSLRSPRRRQKKTWLAFMFAARVRATRLYGRGTRFGFSTSPAKLHCFKTVRRPESRIDERLERGWVCIPDTLFTSSQLAQHDTLRARSPRSLRGRSVTERAVCLSYLSSSLGTEDCLISPKF